jgi:hypothetical protein
MATSNPGTLTRTKHTDNGQSNMFLSPCHDADPIFRIVYTLILNSQGIVALKAMW